MVGYLDSDVDRRCSGCEDVYIAYCADIFVGDRKSIL